MATNKIGDVGYTVGTVSNAIARSGDAAKTLGQAGEAVAEKSVSLWANIVSFFKGIGSNQDQDNSGGE